MLSYLAGKLEGLTWGVAEIEINEGLCEVSNELSKLLEETCTEEP